MTNTTITNFRQNVFEYVKSVIEYNDVVSITTKDGNAVVMSEEEYNGLMETLYLSSVPGLVDDIKEGMSEPVEGMVNADDVEW